MQLIKSSALQSAIAGTLLLVGSGTRAIALPAPTAPTPNTTPQRLHSILVSEPVSTPIPVYRAPSRTSSAAPSTPSQSPATTAPAPLTPAAAPAPVSPSPNPSAGSAATPTESSPTKIRPSLNPLITTPPPDVPGMGGAEAFLPTPESASTIALIIRLGERRVYVYENDQVKISYPIAIGREGWETPTGKWQVMQMIRDPAWQHPLTGEIAPPGADNPLGTRWIGFWTDGTNFVGLHGTPNEASIGTAASHGCVRMYDRDAIALFELVQIGTPVSVVP